MTTNALFDKDDERRGVAAIATLLMVANAVVSGILIFVLAQCFFSGLQVEEPTIESVTLLGYNSRDVADLDNYPGTEITDGSGTTNDNRITSDAPIAFYFKNTGTQTLIIGQLKLQVKL